MLIPRLGRPSGRSRRRLGALLAITALVAPMLLTTVTGPASAEPIDARLDAPAVLPPNGVEPVAVTLITGDTVYWQDNGDGAPRIVEIEEASRDYPVSFDQSGTQEDFYVIPTDAMEHVVAGTVDEELFNIPGLIRQGLTDTATDELPVIVTFDHDRSTQQLARDADALPATSGTTALEELNGAGVKVNRGKAGSFRKAVFGGPKGGSSPRATSAEGLLGAVEQILLDQVLTIDLAESVPQIGAPQAWDAGFTGEGVTVAVLDTGVDTNHPDLVGQVVAAANFTEEPDASDTHGHGTHVASTIAGTGAASGGARKGVAPDAELISGKVCNAQGQCPTSAIMAGMEWATTQGADVVNMSLGGAPTDGTDPLSELVNQLSAETGALFVISAGNTRFGIRVVGSPAAADAALAVGAVDKSDRRAFFSSRGPRVGDHAVKPEITAPGVGIVAARAEGTSLGSPVDDHYTSLNGTSMAAPHVAGAAALLAQATGLGGDELKDVLVSTAADGGYRWYEQGTGRVDVPAALDSSLYAQATLNFGGINGQAAQDLVYTNRSDTDITVSLDAAVTDLSGSPAGGVALSADTLTVPAHGTASVTVTVDASDLTGQESVGGVVTATGPDGVALRTGIGFGPPLHRITIEVLDSNGSRIGSDTATDWAVSLTHDTLDREAGGTLVYRFGTSEGVAVGHVPAGVYTIIAAVVEHKPATVKFTRISMLVQVEVEISANVSVVLDARDAVLIEQPQVPWEADKRNHSVAVIRELPGANGSAFTSAALGSSWPLYATPAPPGQLAPVGLFVSWVLAEPQPLQPIPWDQTPNDCTSEAYKCYSEMPSYVYNLPILYRNGIPQDLHKRITRRDMVEVPTQFHSDHPDALVLQQFESLLVNSPAGAGNAVRIWFQPGEVVEYFLADDHITWNRVTHLERPPLPDGGPTQSLNLYSGDRFPASEAGGRRDEEHWHRAPIRMGMVDVREESLRNPRPVDRWAAASRNGPNGEWFTVPFQVMGSSRGHFADVTTSTWRMWNTDTGTELEQTGLVFPLAPAEAHYRLEHVDDLTSYPVLTRPVTTVWTFTSRPSDAPVPLGYRCLIRLAPRQNVCQIQPLIQLEYDLGLDTGNRARAGRAHLFTITAGHHSKAIDRGEVTDVSVQASFDDGDTWHHARVLGKPRDSLDTGGLLPSAAPYQQFKVLLRIPPLHHTTGFVSLRVQATDTNGGTIDQTIHHAYTLR